MARKQNKNAYGEGSIFYSNVKQKWMAQINVGEDENGKRIRKSVIGNTKEEVQEKLAKLKYEMYSGKLVAANKMTFGQLMNLILKDKLAMNEIQTQTYHRNIETLKICEPLDNIPIQEIDSTMLQQFLVSRIDYAQTTINKIYILLNQCFREAMKRKIITENPMDNVKKPKSRKKTKKIRALTVDEQRKLYEVLQNEKVKYKEQMLISMFTGMRMGEINALYVSDINKTFNFINIDKTIAHDLHGRAFLNDTPKTEAGERNIPINDMVQPVIDEVLERRNLTNDKMLFRADNGNLVTTNQVNNELKRILEKYKIVDKTVKGDITLHSLRHTYATRCIEGGMPPKVLQKLLGHTDIKVTLDTYSDVFESFQTENVQKVDNYLKTSVFHVS